MGRWHTIAERESLIALTADAGLSAVDTIWNHPENAELHDVRQHASLLLPGDRVFIPDPQPGSRAAKTGMRHTFVRRLPKALVRTRVLYHDGTPAAQCRWKLVVGAAHFEGTTDADGKVEQAVPASARTAELTVWLEENDTEVERTWGIDLGHLEPLRDIRGVQSRLRNLGLYTAPEDGTLDLLTSEAIRAFQQRQGLEVTGDADAATCDALQGFYGV